MNTTAIKLRLLKEDKSGLFYLLKILNFQRYFYTYEESYTKKEPRTCFKGRRKLSQT